MLRGHDTIPWSETWPSGASKLKHGRRLASRYDKTADSYTGFILIASARCGSDTSST